MEKVRIHTFNELNIKTRKIFLKKQTLWQAVHRALWAVGSLNDSDRIK